MMAKEIVFVVGKDPLRETGGGHSSYVRAHARAAIRIGFDPHLFCAGFDKGVVQTDFGVVHSCFRRCGVSLINLVVAFASQPPRCTNR
jgi:hypothetical protein